MHLTQLLVPFLVLLLVGCPAGEADDDTAPTDDDVAVDDDDATGDDDTAGDDDSGDDDTGDDDSSDDDETLAQEFSLADTADFAIAGSDMNEWIGPFADLAGDVTGDGRADLLVAAQGDGVGSSGDLAIVFGRTGFSWPVSLADADVRIGCETPGDYCGQTLTTIGDINHDGYDDFTVGAIYRDDVATNGGKAYIVYGRDSGWPATLGEADVHFVGATPMGYAGETASAAGDVNGDGCNDFLIGAPGGFASDQPGTVFLFLGQPDEPLPAGLTDNDADAAFVGEAIAVRAGSALDHGDVDGDGLDDIIIGAEYDGIDQTHPDFDDVHGAVYVVFGRNGGWPDLASADLKWSGEGPTEDRLGHAVACGGDVNGDGLEDIVMSASSTSAGGVGNGGRVYLVFGRTGGWPADVSSADLIYDGVFEGDDLGWYLDMGGDLDADGYDDIVISATQDMIGTAHAGRGIVLLGRSSGWPSTLSYADYVFNGAADSMSYSVRAGGDLDGDGRNDFVIGASGAYDSRGIVYGLLSVP